MSSSVVVPLEFLIKIQGAADAKASIENLGGALANFAKESSTAATGTDRADESVRKVSASLKDSVLAFSAASRSAVELVSQYDNLEKGQLRVEKAELALASAKTALAAREKVLADLTAEGRQGSQEYAAALDRVKNAQDKVAIATKGVENAQGDLVEMQVSFVTDLAPKLISTGSQLQTAFRGISAANTGISASSGAAAAGITAVGRAGRLAQLALGPVGIALFGISTLLTLIGNNTFGLRDRLGGMADFLFPETASSAEDMGRRVETSFEDAQTSAASSAEGQSESLDDLGASYAVAKDSVGGSMDLMRSAVSSSSSSMISDIDRLEKKMSGIGISGSAITGSIAESLSHQAAAPSSSSLSSKKQSGTSSIPDPDTATSEKAADEKMSEMSEIKGRMDSLAATILGWSGGQTIDRLKEIGFQRNDNALGRALQEYINAESELDALQGEKQAAAAVPQQELPRHVLTVDEAIRAGQAKYEAQLRGKEIGNMWDAQYGDNAHVPKVVQLNETVRVSESTAKTQQTITERAQQATNPWLPGNMIILEVDGEQLSAHVNRRMAQRAY